MLLRELVAHAADKFASVGIENAQVDAELIAGFLLGRNRGEIQANIISDATISEELAREYNTLAGRRFAREPLQHLTGLAYFRQLELNVGKGVFIPRPETEVVTQIAIDALRAVASEQPIAVDLGTGSGAIALAMATEVGNSKIYAVEKSDDAISFTRKNFANCAPENAVLIHGDLADAFGELDGTVSVVASNPPYIPLAAVPRDVEVRLHDPELALYGGEPRADPPDQVLHRRLPVRGAEQAGGGRGERRQLFGPHLGRSATETSVGWQ